MNDTDLSGGGTPPPPDLEALRRAMQRARIALAGVGETLQTQGNTDREMRMLAQLVDVALCAVNALFWSLRLFVGDTPEAKG